MALVRLQTPLPAKCYEHITQRIRERKLTSKDVKALSDWVKKQPMVDSGNWYKRFNNFTIVGSGPTATSILTKNMKPHGKEIF